MLTMHSVLKHGGLYWDREVLPAEAYAQRFARIQAAVVESGDAGWFVYGDVARYGCVTYVTNFLPRVRSALAYVPAKGEPALFANIGKRDVPAAKTITWVEDVRPFGRLPGEVVAFIEAEKLTRARIGHAGLEDAIPVVDWAAIDTGVPDVTWQSRDPELSVLRAVKEDWEVAAIARAAAIAGRHHPRDYRRYRSCRPNGRGRRCALFDRQWAAGGRGFAPH
jgi:Xaa-Pro aminopeptidase